MTSPHFSYDFPAGKRRLAVHRHPSPEHEALCRHCGRCCYEKFIVDGHVFTMRKPCRYLDVKTNLCTVYDRRFKLNPRCLTVPEGITLGIFPAGCPYVQDLDDYVPAEAGWLSEDVVRKIKRGEISSYEGILKEVQGADGGGVRSNPQQPRGR